MTYANSEGSDQPAHSRCLIRVFAIRHTYISQNQQIAYVNRELSD